MTSSPQVIISGLSCRLPDSDTPEEFWDNLTNKKDMVSDTPRNWDPKDFDLPKSYGKLKTYDKFDNTFFDVHPKQSEKLDLQIRLLLETIFEAIMDAAINPQELSGTRTGVFIGACGSDFMTNNLNALDKMNGYEATGGANSMFANRISYTFNLKGPSLTVDTACASSLTAFDLAYKAIQRGDCDYAIVGGSSFILHPMWGIAFNRLSLLSPDGRCKSFDQSGNGFVRSEGVIAVLLSKESFARKKYAKVLYSQSNNDGFTENGITFPNREAQMALLRNAYASNAIDVEKLHYIEAHGTGTPAGDPVELGAIEKVLFAEQNRSKKLYVGSVKSNMGHCEGASGLAGLVKVLLSMKHGSIPANLHYKHPREDIPSLHNGRIEVVNELIPFTEGLAAISSFGFGGSNTHLVLEKIPEHKEIKKERSELYPLPYAARTSQGLAQLKKEIKDELEHLPQLSSILTNIYKSPVEKYPHKGFMLANREGDILVDIENVAGSRKLPVWLVLNGVGSQWNGMGKVLVAIPFVKEVLQKCHETLKARHDFDLLEVLTSSDEDTFHSPVNIFTSIAAVQISLYEMLKKLDMRVDGFLGHSIGEIVCAYIDGVLDFEQTLDIAYFRGKAVAESQHTKGAML